MAERVFKYHGLGNDFVVLDRRASGKDIDASVAVAMCDRRWGIGADGVLSLLPSHSGVAKMVVHNADGSIAEMCGNGLRCAAKFLADHTPYRPEKLDVETGAGVLACQLTYDAQGASAVEVAMGPAHLLSANLPSGKTGTPFVNAPVRGFEPLKGSAVSMGNPHLVLFGAELTDASTLGPKLELHPDFVDRTNVEFVRSERSGYRVVVWERGVGVTQACGTGACAVVAAAVNEGRSPPEVWTPVALPGGTLNIWVREDLSQVRLSGPATFVFAAEY
ncbi:MAG: diaminopimelate epimerase [Myxococcaceae bacterium]